MSELLEFYGPNAGYVLELYDAYSQNPELVDTATRQIFEHWSPDGSTFSTNGFHATLPVSAADLERSRTFPEAGQNGDGAGHPANSVPVSEPSLPQNPASVPQAVGSATTTDMIKVVAVARISRLVRELGHLDSHIDPLGGAPPHDPSLDLNNQGLTTEDMAAMPAFVVGGPIAERSRNAGEALATLRTAYSGTIGYEDDHIQVAAERLWLREAVETGQFFKDFTDADKRDLLERLTEVETFERYLHTTPPFQGQKRFSIEGTDMLVPMLDTLIHCTANAGTREVVIGMAHRGRLNVLAHVLGKPYEVILSEFPKPNAITDDAEDDQEVSASTSAQGYSGDVKYHLGHRRAYTEDGVKEMPITLAPNPSHLEFVNPAVMGRARAAQEVREGRGGAPIDDQRASLAILIHGDAAFPGQGIVAETLNMSQLPGYSVGGTIHIIANNQIGFTTLPGDDRSTLYSSDLAKGFEMPIVHVNADDPVACIVVARMACAYRERFAKDFLIDLVGYRRWGHNESDQPAFTQPRMYEKIRNHATVREIWAQQLIQENLITEADAQALVEKVRARLNEAKNTTVPHHPAQSLETGDTSTEAATGTGVPAERLTALNEALVALPEGFTLDTIIEKRFRQPRTTALETDGAINWGHAEALAFASILEDGIPIRLTGQDSERGTFGHRNAVLHDPLTGETYCSLQSIPQAKASFAIHNSPLSEQAALGFEYGYSVHASKTLVLWEAQFGDFANGAQVIIDQFIASGQAKWRQVPSLVLLLPHGYEGSGPEHSSARLERFLQLCAGDSMRVVNCTTPAQFFHLLRRQAALLESAPRPLVVMTPKSLLRHPRVGASLSDLTAGSFQPILDDPRPPSRKSLVTRLIFCSGKIYIDLMYQGNKFEPRAEVEQAENIAVIRVEELNPFPADALATLIATYPNLHEAVWMQEEPRNMGAWTFIQPRLSGLLPDTVALEYVGRAEAASPAEGKAHDHEVEQNRIIHLALQSEPFSVSSASNGNGTGLSGAKKKTKRTEVTANGR